MADRHDKHLHVVVETPRGSAAKLKFDAKLKVFTLAKPLLVGLTILTTGASCRPPGPKTAIRSTP